MSYKSTDWKQYLQDKCLTKYLGYKKNFYNSIIKKDKQSN